MIFRQLFDQTSSSYTYLLADSSSGEAILIDTVFEQSRRDRALLNELDLKLIHVLDTHCHADHVTGAWLLKQQTDSKIGISTAANVEGADNYFEHGAQIHFGARYITARATPGHTSGCMSYILDDESMAFTGDALLIRGCGRTDFQEGDARTLYQSIKMQILTLPDQTHIYPGHDYRGLMLTTVAEEKKFNSRVGGKTSENDFVGYMENLGLPHPGKIDIAVPANLKSGRPNSASLPEDEPDWAPLIFTYGGIWEIDSNWLIDHLADVQIIDVREEDEFNGPLGHIANAKLIPLGNLKNELDLITRDSPIITVCRSGARSAQATIMLRQAGLTKIANLHGGMLHWQDQALSVSGGILEPDYQI